MTGLERTGQVIWPLTVGGLDRSVYWLLAIRRELGPRGVTM
jgi:hypothetical protein